MHNENAKVGVARLAGRQFGLVSTTQLQERGVSRRTIHDWVKAGYLHLVLPRVYGVGHSPSGQEAKLAAALIYAGPEAMLSHATAAWWLGLADSKAHRIEVSTPRRCRSITGIEVHQRRNLERDWHRGLPVTQLVQTLRDYAVTASRSELRRALAQADYDGRLDLAAIEADLGPGRAGSAKLRQGLERHQPKLAYTKSRLERALVGLCEAGGLSLPELNTRVAGWEVDAVWRDQRVVVELDGWRNHHSPAQVNRDRRKEFALRAAGFTVIRYSEEQIVQQPDLVLAELRRLLGLTNPEPSA
jgi:very-short-patch-repair endonuclease